MGVGVRVWVAVVRYFVWNCKGILWNSTRSILHINRNMCSFYRNRKCHNAEFVFFKRLSPSPLCCSVNPNICSIQLCASTEAVHRLQDTLTIKVILYDLGEYYIRVEFCHNDNFSLIHISQKKSSEWFWIYLMIYAARVCRHVRNELIQNLITYSMDFTYQMGYS